MTCEYCSNTENFDVTDLFKRKIMTEFNNESGLDFTDISSEEIREYRWPDALITIKNPLYLNVSDNGHRIYDNDGYSHYIPKGWISLKWKSKPGEPNFVK